MEILFIGIDEQPVTKDLDKAKKCRSKNTYKQNVPKLLSNLNPFWVTGFVDAEGSFTMSIFSSRTAAIGWTIEPCFIITLHLRDIDILYAIKDFFTVGSVRVVGNCAQYRVRSRADLKVIIEHFVKYPLQTSKALHFLYFCEILNYFNNKVHTKVEGFLMLVSLINQLNNPISETTLTKIKELGPLTSVEFETDVSSTDTSNVKSLNPYWLAGFITGEGCFTYFTRTRKTSSGKIVKDYTVVFEVSQRTRDIHILNLIVSYFGVGNVYSDSKGISRYRLGAKNLIISILISYFDNYPLEGYKALQYQSWIKIVKLLADQPKSEQRDLEVEKLIKKLSELKY